MDYEKVNNCPSYPMRWPRMLELHCLLQRTNFLRGHDRYIIVIFFSKGQVTLPKRINFWKSSKVGGVIFNPKFLLQISDFYTGLF